MAAEPLTDNLQILRAAHYVLVATTGAVAGFALSSDSDEVVRYSRLLQDATTVTEWVQELHQSDFDEYRARLVEHEHDLSSRMKTALGKLGIEAGPDLTLTDLIVVNFGEVNLDNVTGTPSGYFLSRLEHETMGFVPDDIEASLSDALEPYRNNDVCLERLSSGASGLDTRDCTATILLRGGAHHGPAAVKMEISGKNKSISGGSLSKWWQSNLKAKKPAPTPGVQRNLSEFSAVPICESIKEIEEKRRGAVAKAKIALFGIEVGASTAGIVLPLATLAVLALLFAHLLDVKTSDIPTLKSFGWIGFFVQPFGKILSFFSICFAPAAVNIWLLSRVRRYTDSKRLIVGSIIVIGICAIAVFTGVCLSEIQGRIQNSVQTPNPAVVAPAIK